MTWTPEPATERQLTYLRKLGYVSDRSLTRMEAAQLIRELQDQQVSELQKRSQAQSEHEPDQLRLKVERARSADAKTLAQAITERQEFWADTCRDVGQMHVTSKQVIELYKQYGCRFQVPTHLQVQGILEALDSAAPAWDRNHPELFYQTLELNFPELVRHF